MNDADPDPGIVAMGTVEKPCSCKSWVPFVAKKACPTPPDRKRKTVERVWFPFLVLSSLHLQ